MDNHRRLDRVPVSSLSLFHHELCRQRTFLIKAEFRDDQNRSDPEFQARHRFKFCKKKQRVISVAVRLANRYRSGTKQMEVTNLFRNAVQFTRGDGTAGVILPILKSAFETHKALVCGVADGGVPSLLVEKHRKATQRLQEFLPVAGHVADESAPDGPYGHCQWRHSGEVIEGTMQVGAWNMAKHLWGQADRTAGFDELIISVYGDSNHIADENAFGSLRKAANQFFRDNGISLAVSLSKSTVSMRATK